LLTKGGFFLLNIFIYGKQIYLQQNPKGFSIFILLTKGGFFCLYFGLAEDNIFTYGKRCPPYIFPQQ